MNVTSRDSQTSAGLRPKVARLDVKKLVISKKIQWTSLFSASEDVKLLPVKVWKFRIDSSSGSEVIPKKTEGLVSAPPPQAVAG